MNEEPIWIECADDALFGIYTRPVDRVRASVLIVTGGPQYRAGSHRQFTQLARQLAAKGYASLRFDVRGMGDSTGEPRSFTDIDEDIDAALRALAARSGTSALVILGLCDAASAALLFIARQRTAALPIAGLVLLNPWVRDPVSLAQAQLKHYYGARLAQGDFWRKLVGGKFDAAASARSFASSLWTALRPGSRVAANTRFQDVMAAGLARFSGAVLLVTCSQDLTAREFSDYAASDPHWRGLLDPSRLAHREIEADHTFSAPRARAQLEHAVGDWLSLLDVTHPRDRITPPRGAPITDRHAHCAVDCSNSREEK